ncbi:MAG: hypothetical protein CHACPFDD_02938 [Phycisphaerae bacterium]|nr:hypothetical protein [Phycisphaerae bacterium]
MSPMAAGFSRAGEKRKWPVPSDQRTGRVTDWQEGRAENILPTFSTRVENFVHPLDN